MNSGVLHGAPGRIEIPAGSFLQNGGHVTGDVDIIGELANTGHVDPGESPGTVHVTGDYIQEAGGSLRLELGGAVAGTDYDQLVVDGVATLGGTLTLACVDGVFPSEGSVFQPLSAGGGFAGDFARIMIEVPSGRQRFAVSSTATEVVAQAEVLDVSTFGAWRQAVFTAGQLADPTISGAGADPEGDLLTTLAEYVFDGNPLLANPALVEVSLDGNAAPGARAVQITFPWAKGVSDYDYLLECSGSLGTWESLSHSVVNAEDLGLVTRLTLAADLPAGDIGFVRLAVRELSGIAAGFRHPMSSENGVQLLTRVDDNISTLLK